MVACCFLVTGCCFGCCCCCCCCCFCCGRMKPHPQDEEFANFADQMGVSDFFAGFSKPWSDYPFSHLLILSWRAIGFVDVDSEAGWDRLPSLYLQMVYHCSQFLPSHSLCLGWKLEMLHNCRRKRNTLVVFTAMVTIMVQKQPAVNLQ